MTKLDCWEGAIMHGKPDPRPVVVAVDFSDSARDAAAWAADVAADWSAPLRLLHVLPGDPQDLPPDTVPGWLTELGDLADRAGAHHYTCEALPGDVVATVTARSVGARMVVLGSYGKDAYAGMLAGSVALGVVGRVACPVAIVRGSAPRLAPPRNGPVVVGLDGTQAGTAALAVGADLASSLGAKLVVVHVWSEVGVSEEGSPYRKHRSPQELAAEATTSVAARLAPVSARYPTLQVEQEIVEGTPLRSLIQRAPAARVLVVGTRGRTGHTGMLMGSTSNALLEFAPCPVVVVHPRGSVPDVTMTAPGAQARS